jgi:hypothetical protein
MRMILIFLVSLAVTSGLKSFFLLKNDLKVFNTKPQKVRKKYFGFNINVKFFLEKV